MKEQTHTTTNEASLIQQVLEVMDYVHNQRIFLMGKPMMSQFNYLICGYGDRNYGELLQKKVNKEKNE